jgi:hypothetical protein
MRFILAVTLMLLMVAPAAARTFIIAHAPMRSGTTTSADNFDATIQFVYGTGLDYGMGLSSSSVDVEIYLFNEDGTPLRASGAVSDLCNPCTFPLSSSTPTETVRLDDLIIAGGGFPSNFIAPFAIVETSSGDGGDPDDVAIQSFVTNSHTGPLDLSFFAMPLEEVGASSGIYVFPTISETSGTTASPNEFDTALEMVYAAGVGGIPTGAGVSADLYLFDASTGAALTASGGGNVCDPCNFSMGPSAGKETARIHNLINDAGGFGSGAVSAVGVLVSSGDIDNFAATAWVVNSHTGPFDLGAHVYSPDEIPGIPPRTSVTPEQVSRIVQGLRGVPNPFNPRTTVMFSLASPAKVTVDIFDPRGRRVRTLFSGSLREGPHSLPWDGKDDAGVSLGSGVYVSRVQADGVESTQKLALVR